MRKKILLVASLFLMVISIVSCSSETLYKGFEEIPADYTSEQAIADGCYVLENLTSIGGEEALESFLNDVDNGKDSFLRTMYIYDQDNKYTVAYGDLIYKKGSYTYYDSSAEKLTGDEYKYFLELKPSIDGQEDSPSLSVLTDDENLTFEDVIKGMYSSSTEVQESIPPFRIIFMGE